MDYSITYLFLYSCYQWYFLISGMVLSVLNNCWHVSKKLLLDTSQSWTLTSLMKYLKWTLCLFNIFRLAFRNCRHFVHFSTDGTHGEAVELTNHFTFQAPARTLQLSYNICFPHIYAILTFQSLLGTWCTNKFNVQELYALPTLYLSQNKQRLVPLTSYRLVFITETKSVYCAVRAGSLNKAVWASSLKG